MATKAFSVWLSPGTSEQRWPDFFVIFIGHSSALCMGLFLQKHRLTRANPLKTMHLFFDPKRGGFPTIKRLEAADGVLGGRETTAQKIRVALERAGVEFIDENGGGPGVRLRKRQRAKKQK